MHTAPVRAPKQWLAAKVVVHPGVGKRWRMWQKQTRLKKDVALGMVGGRRPWWDSRTVAEDEVLKRLSCEEEYTGVLRAEADGALCLETCRVHG